MLRPNIVMDEPPTTITVGGLSYKVATDFRIWIDVMRDMRDMVPDAESEDDILHNSEIVTIVSAKVLGRPIKWEGIEQIGEFISEVTGFLKGYPQAPVESDSRERAQTYSFEYDLAPICIAFRKYYGIDISYRQEEPLHWWIFLEYFRNLCGDDLMILKLMEIRGYSGKDKELRRQASRFALPVEQTYDEKKALEEIADEFYGAR